MCDVVSGDGIPKKNGRDGECWLLQCHVSDAFEEIFLTLRVV